MASPPPPTNLQVERERDCFKRFLKTAIQPILYLFDRSSSTSLLTRLDSTPPPGQSDANTPHVFPALEAGTGDSFSSSYPEQGIESHYAYSDDIPKGMTPILQGSALVPVIGSHNMAGTSTTEVVSGPVTSSNHYELRYSLRILLCIFLALTLEWTKAVENTEPFRVIVSNQDLLASKDEQHIGGCAKFKCSITSEL